MRKFMVVMDGTPEFLNALYFAAKRAENSGGGVVILGVTGPEFQTWLGVGQAMREDTEEHMRAHYELFRKWMEGKVHIEPELVIRHGNTTEQILATIEADPEIGVLVLGAGTDRKGPGPMVKDLVAKRGGSMPIPITIVPGKLSREEILKIT